MRNKYNYDELVVVNGIGKLYGKVKNKLGFIKEKDPFFQDYYIDLIFGKKDWFEEKNITRILGTKKNKVEKYQVRLCTTKKGYELIEANIKKQEPINNNKLKQMSIHRSFTKNNKQYKIIGWNSVYWPVSNKSINIMENTIRTFRELNIPYQYIVLNEENIIDIEIHQFIENDSNVDIFWIERKIKMKKLQPLTNSGRKEKNNDCKKNTKCNE